MDSFMQRRATTKSSARLAGHQMILSHGANIKSQKQLFLRRGKISQCIACQLFDYLLINIGTGVLIPLVSGQTNGNAGAFVLFRGMEFHHTCATEIGYLSSSSQDSGRILCLEGIHDIAGIGIEVGESVCVEVPHTVVVFSTARANQRNRRM